MKDELVGTIGDEDAYAALHEHDLMKMFDELTFREKWKRVSEGLKQPKESGEHKWAKLQMLRLLSPAAAVIIPVLMLGLITLLAQIKPVLPPAIVFTVVEPDPMEELKEIIKPEIVPPEPLVPTIVETEISSVMPSLPSEVITPPAETASVKPAEADAVAQVKSPTVMKHIYGSRTPGERGAALGEYGGTRAGQDAVLRALRWLAKNQNSDGSWNNDKPAMTSLAVLAYLAYDVTPTHEEFGTVVESALRFLTGAQEPSGRFIGRDKHDYTHPITAYALAEAYGMAPTPAVKEAAVKALGIVVKGQNASGGFNYNLEPSGRDDTSYMAWCVQAMKAAQMAKLSGAVDGLDDAMKKAVLGFRKNYKFEGGYGGFGYTSPSYTHGLTGAGILCMQFLGQARSREVRGALPQMMKSFPFDWENPNGRSPVYYWYYNTQAAFQEGGAVWDSWNKQYQMPLTNAQKVIGKEASGYVDHKGQPQAIGSWNSPGKTELTGGNGEVMDTILCTLMLEVYYRYLPTFKQIPAEEIETELGTGTDELEIRIVEVVGAKPKT
jgi:hypothetical protein